MNDYPGTGSDLAGCVNDAHDWQAALEQRGFTVQLLLNQEATRDGMQEAIGGLVREARPGDLVVITYSGHGSWIADRDADEPDARDEVLCPYDIAQNRPLSDDVLYDMFADRERGVRIVFISDSRHSGSVSRIAPARRGADAPRVRFLPLEHFAPPETVQKAAKQGAYRAAGAPRPCGGVLLSGCQDTEYSYDAVFDQRPNGAFTYYALQALDSCRRMPVIVTGIRRSAPPCRIKASLRHPNSAEPALRWTGRSLKRKGGSLMAIPARMAGGACNIAIQQQQANYLNRTGGVTMATATKDIEQTIRRVLSEVLTEVSDELTTDAGETDAGEPTPNGATSPAPSNKAARAPAGKPPLAPSPGGADGGEAEAPENGASIPPAVLTAAQAVCRDLSSEQTGAVAAMFEAMGRGQSGEAEEGEEEEEEEEEDPQTKAFIELATRKPAELQAAVDALTPPLDEEDDGTVTIAAPRNVVKGVDREAYRAITDLFEQANEDVRSGTLDTKGARFLPILWPVMLRLIIRTAISMGAKIVWSRVPQGLRAVRAKYRKFPGKPGSGPWLSAAARCSSGRCRR